MFLYYLFIWKLKNKGRTWLTFHYVLFVVTVIVAIGGSVEDVEAINGSVIDRCVLQKEYKYLVKCLTMLTFLEFDHGKVFSKETAYRPLQDDCGLIDGFIVGDVGSINGTSVGWTTAHHCVGFRGSAWWTRSQHINGQNSELVWCSCKCNGKKNKVSFSCVQFFYSMAFLTQLLFI